MKLFRFRRVTLAAMLLAGLASGGCKDEAGSANNSVVPAHAKPGPKESFDLIVETFRRRVEDTPIGFVMSDSGGRSMMTGKSTVSAELIPPANEKEKYKAVITVESQTSYSINRSKPGSEKDSSREEDANEESNPLAQNDESDGQILDPDLVSQSGEENGAARPQPETAKDIVAQHPDVRKRQYELVYDNGRWKLVTELDKLTEQSIQNAFDQALKSQG